MGDDPRGVLRLFTGGHQGVAVFQRPAMKLHGGDFDAARAHFLGHFQGAGQLVQVAPMQDGVQRQRKPNCADPFSDHHFAFEPAFIAADFIRHFGIGALQGQLDVIQPGSVQFGQTSFREANSGCDQVCIKPGVSGRFDQRHQIAARGRFTT